MKTYTREWEFRSAGGKRLRLRILTGSTPWPTFPSSPQTEVSLQDACSSSVTGGSLADEVRKVLNLEDDDLVCAGIDTSVILYAITASKVGLGQYRDELAAETDGAPPRALPCVVKRLQRVVATLRNKRRIPQAFERLHPRVGGPIDESTGLENVSERWPGCHRPSRWPLAPWRRPSFCE